MIPRDLLERLNRLTPQERIAMGTSVRELLESAMKEFMAGKLGELEMLIVASAVNDALADMFPGSGYEAFSNQAHDAIRERVAEICGGRSVH